MVRTLTYLGRILIVDDEPKIRSFIGRALAAAGYATEFADSGAEGLRRALATRYNLVILDLVMPDLDGRQVLGRLLAARPGQAVIVLSCVADVAAKVDCLERGAQDYLTKPFSLAELLARVRVRLRGEPHAHAEAAARTAAGNGTAEPGGPQAPQPSALSAPSAQGSAGGDAHPHAEMILAGDVTLDVGRLVADIGNGPVPLTRLEFLLLRELAEHVGQSVPKGDAAGHRLGLRLRPGLERGGRVRPAAALQARLRPDQDRAG